MLTSFTAGGSMLAIRLKEHASLTLGCSGLSTLLQRGILTPVVSATIKANGASDSLMLVSRQSHIRLWVNQIWDGCTIARWLSQSKGSCIFSQFALASRDFSVRLALCLLSRAMPQSSRTQCVAAYQGWVLWRGGYPQHTLKVSVLNPRPVV